MNATDSPVIRRNKHLTFENPSSRNNSPKPLRKASEIDGVTALILGNHPEERREMVEFVSRVSEREQKRFIFPFIQQSHHVIKSIDLLSKVCAVWPYLTQPNILYLPFRDHLCRQSNRLYIKSELAVLRPGPDVLGDHTPLTFACSYYELEVIRKLIEQEENVNEPNAAGNTPLLIAAGYNRPDVVELLLQNSAIPDLGAIRYACKFGNIEIAKKLLATKQTGLNLDDNLAPIHIATCAGDEALVQQHLTDETKNLQTNEGWAPIHFACKTGNLEMVRLFFTLKNQHLLTKDGKTPLLIARENNHDEITKFITSQIALTSR